jgi:hypothetical protein
MAQAKGKTGNPNGRPVGSKNAKTEQWEALGHALVTKHSERANRVLDSLSDMDFMDQYGKLLEYFKPKQSRSVVQQEGTQTIDIVIKRKK